MIAGKVKEGDNFRFSLPPDFDVIGYFSLGEFGKLDEGRCEFQGTAISWLAIK